jgi:hypothetical protein
MNLNDIMHNFLLSIYAALDLKKRKKGTQQYGLDFTCYRFIYSQSNLTHWYSELQARRSPCNCYGHSDGLS